MTLTAERQSKVFTGYGDISTLYVRVKKYFQEGRKKKTTKKINQGLDGKGEHAYEN